MPAGGLPSDQAKGDVMTPNILPPQPRPIADHRPRPWRPPGPEPRRRQAVIPAFSSAVVRELPPRREPATSLADWSRLRGHGGLLCRLGRLALGRDPHNIPRQARALHPADEERGDVDLPRAEAVARRSREGVVVVVPCLAQPWAGRRGDPALAALGRLDRLERPRGALPALTR